MLLKESAILILERSFQALNWYLTFAQCLLRWSRMKATWNMPPLKITLFILTLMFMQWLLCSPVCPGFSLDAFLSKPSLSPNTCLGAYFSHYTDETLQTSHCTHYTHLLLTGMALPNWFTPNSPHPPFFPPLNSSLVDSKNGVFNSYSLKGTPHPSLHTEKIIQLYLETF